MAKIIIEYDEKIGPVQATYLVYQVLFRGKIALDGKKPHYPTITRIFGRPGLFNVLARKKKKGQEADSFFVGMSSDTRPMLVKD